jgi:hypothetical protein
VVRFYNLVMVHWFSHINLLVVPVTFRYPWLRHSSHPERTVVPTDVVRVSEPTVCTFELSVRVFIPLFILKKPKTPVLTFWTLVPESFGNFRKHVPLYIIAGSFGSVGGGGGGEGFYIRLWCGGRGMRFDRHSYPSDGCNVLWRRFVHGNRGGPTPVSGLHRSPVASPASPSPTPQNPCQTDWRT